MTIVELRKVDPQFLFNGEHNVWILKPGGKSRGRGIQCFDTLLVCLFSPCFMLLLLRPILFFN
jgi:hypothetical protein